MAEALILEFSGVGIEEYQAVNNILGLDGTTGGGDWPAGMVSHVAATGEGGNLAVVEVWDTQAAQGEFMSSRLGPALAQAGLPEPTRIAWFSVVGAHHSH